MLLLEAASSMNCSVVCTAPRSSRYFSLRSRCDFASAAVYQVPLRLNSHAEASSLRQQAVDLGPGRGRKRRRGRRRRDDSRSAERAADAARFGRFRRRRAATPPRAASRSAESTASRRPCAWTSSSPARCRSASRPRRSARSIPGCCRPAPAGPRTPASGHVGVEELGEPLRERRAVDHQAHLGVEQRRALVEVERADEDAAAVDGERLRVQARGRARSEPGLLVRALPSPRSA